MAQDPDRLDNNEVFIFPNTTASPPQPTLPLIPVEPVEQAVDPSVGLETAQLALGVFGALVMLVGMVLGLWKLIRGQRAEAQAILANVIALLQMLHAFARR